MSTNDTKLAEDLTSGGVAPDGSTVVQPPSADLPPPSVDFDTVTGGAPRSPGDESAGAGAADATIVGVSFESTLRAQEFLIAMGRLEQDGLLDLADAVLVHKDTDGKVKVAETVDPTVGGAALSGAVWTSLLGLLLGGPVGWIAGLGVGAGAGAVTAKLVDLGLPDEWVDWFKDAVRPGTSTVVVLANDVSISALEAEARRFAGAELLYSTLPNATIDRLRTAFDGE